MTERITTHPGEVLHEEFMAPLGLSANRLGQLIGVPHNRISEIVKERRGVTPDTALRLARLFSTTPEFWLNLQRDHDLSKARAEIGGAVQAQVHPLEA
ncbi:MAG: HigA family addiction module antitoxin [Kiloniellaceae bacterium]